MREYNRSNRGGRDSGRSFNRGRSERPEMFEAICDQCGKPCKVPFRPSGDKPVYCSACFDQKGGDDRGRNRDRRPSYGRDSFRSRDDRQMYSVVCDQCGKECEVPFKPSSNKPVLCNECFGEKNGRREQNSNKECNCECENIKADMEELNKKLDRIISILEPIKEVRATKKAIKKEVDEVVEDIKKTAKKVVKKAKAVKEDLTE